MTPAKQAALSRALRKAAAALVEAASALEDGEVAPEQDETAEQKPLPKPRRPRNMSALADLDVGARLLRRRGHVVG